MFHTRPFLNTDVAQIVEVWNRHMKSAQIASPLSVSEFDQFVFSRPYFDSAGMIVATDTETGKVVGFVHCGFGPADPERFCHAVDQSMATIAVVCAETGRGIETILIKAGLRYLHESKAKVIYAGGRFPLNPFYWGIYGGSEFSGVLDCQNQLQKSILECGFQKVATSVIFEFDLSRAEPRHIKNALLRRDSRVMILEEETPPCQWTTLALESFHPLTVKILGKNQDALIARACLWPMSLFGRVDHRSRIGLIDLLVEDDYRRKGFGRLLVTESIKCAAELGYDLLCVQTDSTNQPAIELYEQAGFEKVATSSFFRLGA